MGKKITAIVLGMLIVLFLIPMAADQVVHRLYVVAHRFGMTFLHTNHVVPLTWIIALAAALVLGLGNATKNRVIPTTHFWLMGVGILIAAIAYHAATSSDSVSTSIQYVLIPCNLDMRSPRIFTIAEQCYFQIRIVTLVFACLGVSAGNSIIRVLSPSSLDNGRTETEKA